MEDLSIKMPLKLDLEAGRATGILCNPQRWSLPSAATRTGIQPHEQEPCMWMQLGSTLANSLKRIMRQQRASNLRGIHGVSSPKSLQTTSGTQQPRHWGEGSAHGPPLWLMV